MSRQKTDKLEEFFRKAAARPDVSFNEADWKKLEAKLDAEQAAADAVKPTVRKVVTGTFIAAILLFSGGLWLNSHYQIVERSTGNAVPIVRNPAPGPQVSGDSRAADPGKKEETSNLNPAARLNPAGLTPSNTNGNAPGTGAGKKISVDLLASEETDGETFRERGSAPLSVDEIETGIIESHDETIRIAAVQDEKISSELNPILPAHAEKIKQKAVVDLPGAEEEDRREARAVVQEEYASVQKQQLVAPRLSLLLSFAPDFSSTAINEYSGPGKAFGAMLHYHIRSRWSLSAGVIKNYKRYSGSGEYYKPPTGYWKRNTNGIIPSTIDGSCSLLEFPVTIQYVFASNAKNKWVAGAGASSYLMQTESYKYTFEEPNPGAKEGWNSRNSSHFFFNMINFSIGFERQVLPGLLIGIEPYVKVPIEAIGWSNLKLFSTGASLTLRYTILRKRGAPVSVQSRPPD